MKESVGRDMESFSSKGIHGPEEYSYGTDDPWEKRRIVIHCQKIKRVQK